MLQVFSLFTTETLAFIQQPPPSPSSVIMNCSSGSRLVQLIFGRRSISTLGNVLYKGARHTTTCKSSNKVVKNDFYQVLGGSKNASLKRAFCAPAHKHHQDINQDDPAAEKKFLEIFKEAKSSMKKNKHVEIPGYLCVSNGCEIFLLDLKEDNINSFTEAKDIPFLPKLGTLNLMEKGLPTFVGLFNLGSKAYMIGGSHGGLKASSCHIYNLSLPDSLTFKSETTLLKNPKQWPKVENPHGTKLHGNLYTESVVKCSIGGISAVKSGITRLKRPKLCPIVEKIGGQIHVIDPIPFPSFESLPPCSHEVLNHDQESWSCISMVKDVCEIESHLVLGHHIYATSFSHKMLFDSTTRHWEARHITRYIDNPLTAKDVWDIIGDGIGRCVRGVTYQVLETLLYVVIALVHNRDDDDPSKRAIYAVAYLVTPTGKVVCFQPLPHLMVVGSLKPSSFMTGTMIDCDDKGETMCYLCVDKDKHFFMCTFTVEGLAEANSKVAQVWEKGEQVWPVEQDFVRVQVKGSSIYNLNDRHFYENRYKVQACFLPD